MALVLEAEPTHATAKLQQRHQIAEPAPRIGRRAQQPLPQHGDDLPQRRRIGVVILRILCRMPRNLAPRQPVPAGQQIVRPLGREEIVDLAEHDLQAMLVQPHVADDLGVQEADRVARRRVSEARMEFLGHGRPTDDAPRLDHRHLEAALGEIEGAGQRIVPRADDQDIALPRLGHDGPIARRVPDFKAVRGAERRWPVSSAIPGANRAILAIARP